MGSFSGMKVEAAAATEGVVPTKLKRIVRSEPRRCDKRKTCGGRKIDG